MDDDRLTETEQALADMGLCIRQINTDYGGGGFGEFCGEPKYTEGLAQMDLDQDPDLSYCAPHIWTLQDEGHPDLRHVPLPDDVAWQAWQQDGFTREEYDAAVQEDLDHEASMEHPDEN